MNIKKITSMILILTSPCTHADEYIYMAKKSDTLSEILHRLQLKPIYGKNGSLASTLKLNSNIKSNGNFIMIGQPIRINKNLFSKSEELPNGPSQSSDIGFSLEGVNYPVKKEALDTLPSREFSSEDVSINNDLKLPIEFNNKDSTEIIMKDVNSIESSDDDQYYYLKLSPQVSWRKITANSSNEYLLTDVSAITKASPGINFAFGINYSDQLSLEVSNYLSQVSFYEPSRFNISDSQFVTQSYNIIADFKINKNYSSYFGFGFYDEFFITSLDTSRLNIIKAQMPEVFFGVRHLITQKKNISLESEMFGKVILPNQVSTINGKMGFGLGGDFTLKFKNKGIKFFYNYSNARAENNSVKNFELGWNLIFEGKFYD